MLQTLARISCHAVVCGTALGAGSQAVAQTVTLHYNSRPPYLVMQEGVLSGLTGSPALAAFKTGGIAYTLAETPPARQLKLLKDNQGIDCAIGWFRNPERETFAKFTKPIYQDEPQIVLMASDNPKIKPTDSIEAVLSNPDLNLLVKNAYSYGKGLDALIEKHNPKRQVVSSENIHMFKMVQAQRADYMFTAPEEAAVTIPIAGLQPHQFKQL